MKKDFLADLVNAKIDRRSFLSNLAMSVAGLSLCPNLAFAKGGVNSLRIGHRNKGVRIVFDANEKFDYRVFLLANPKRLVVDVESMMVNPSIEKKKYNNNLVGNVRIGKIGVGDSRIVFDLSKPSVVEKSFFLPPQGGFGWRFVVDIKTSTQKEFNKNVGSSNIISSNGSKPSKVANESYAPAKQSKSTTKKVVILDPGHGGKDPGAIGYSGTYEKRITLAMGKELKSLLEATGRYKVYMTRSSDRAVSLGGRVKYARKRKGDLFISLHADSIKNKRTKGLSVYTLSENASDKAAARLAEKENKADIVAGIDFTEQPKEVANILIDLVRRETMNRSSEFATNMVGEMKKVAKLLRNTHRFAGFAVLKAQDIPSVLLEMGYLSNKSEERLLKTRSYRKKIAKSTVRAVDKYFNNIQHASLI